MMPTAKRVVTWRTEHTRRTLVEKLDFVTATGNMATLVTPFAVFQRVTAAGSRFRLESWNEAYALDEIVERTGFAFEIEGALRTASPTAREMDGLKALDGDGRFAAGLA
jgi:glutaconate CoA-transferase subunit B